MGRPNYYDEKRRAAVDAYCDANYLTAVERCIQLEDDNEALRNALAEMTARAGGAEAKHIRCAESFRVYEEEAEEDLAEARAELADMVALLREARDSVIEDKMSAEAHEMQHSAAELGKLLDRIDARIGEGEG